MKQKSLQMLLLLSELRVQEVLSIEEFRPEQAGSRGPSATGVLRTGNNIIVAFDVVGAWGWVE